MFFITGLLLAVCREPVGIGRSQFFVTELLLRVWQLWTYEMAKGRAFRVACGKRERWPLATGLPGLDVLTLFLRHTSTE